ncbi:hypothetical protein H6F51_02465 [Cyanobacteria bacterium FACHB-DQ100]|nr:hypothetical protein [Cyanobacteria bacterium FACHB-DQ100]
MRLGFVAVNAAVNGSHLSPKPVNLAVKALNILPAGSPPMGRENQY